MKNVETKNWKTIELNASFLVDSGLLFEINRSILHLFGIALTVKDSELSFKDCREKPEELVFDKGTIDLGTDKLKKFMDEFGNSQDARRCKKLGFGVQYCGQK